MLRQEQRPGQAGVWFPSYVLQACNYFKMQTEPDLKTTERTKNDILNVEGWEVVLVLLLLLLLLVVVIIVTTTRIKFLKF